MQLKNNYPLFPGLKLDRMFAAVDKMEQRLSLDDATWGPFPAQPGKVYYVPDVLVYHMGVEPRLDPSVNNGQISLKSYDAFVPEVYGNFNSNDFGPWMSSTKNLSSQVIAASYLPDFLTFVAYSDLLPGSVIAAIREREGKFTPETIELLAGLGPIEIANRYGFKHMNVQSYGPSVPSAADRVFAVIAQYGPTWSALYYILDNKFRQPTLHLAKSDPNAPLPGRNNLPPTISGQTPINLRDGTTYLIKRNDPQSLYFVARPGREINLQLVPNPAAPEVPMIFQVFRDGAIVNEVTVNSNRVINVDTPGEYVLFPRLDITSSGDVNVVFKDSPTSPLYPPATLDAGQSLNFTVSEASAVFSLPVGESTELLIQGTNSVAEPV